MKLRVLLASLLYGLCLMGSPQLCSAQDYETVLLEYIEVWNSGELDRLDGLVSADFQRHAGPGESCESIDALKNIITDVRRTFDRLELRLTEHLTAGDQGAFRGEFYGVHRNVNRVVEFSIMSMFRFSDGRIAEEWILGNNFLSLVGLGYELVPPGFEVVVPIESADSPAAEGDR